MASSSSLRGEIERGQEIITYCRGPHRVLSFEAVAALRARGYQARRLGRCRVVGGLWFDLYTGQSFTDAADVEVDHVVPLKEAHRSGGHAWTRERRRGYANNLRYTDHLIAVDSHTNGVVKGDRDPSGYLPEVEAFRCRYIEAWLRIKRAWELNMDAAEAEAIETVLADCTP